MTCRCNKNRQREVAVYPDADTVNLFIVACDECDEGRALIKARLNAAVDAAKGGKVARQTASLSEMRANLDRDRQRGSPVDWRVDPDFDGRMAPSRRVGSHGGVGAYIPGKLERRAGP